MYGAKAKLLGRRRCLCQNLIINPPYCEKWVSPELLFFRQRSSVWSGALSSPIGAVPRWLWEWLQHTMVGPASLHFFWALSVPFCRVSKSGLEAEAPSQSLSFHLQIFLRAPWLDCGPSLLWVVVGGQKDPPTTNSPQQELVIFILLPSYCESGRAMC